MQSIFFSALLQQTRKSQFYESQEQKHYPTESQDAKKGQPGIESKKKDDIIRQLEEQRLTDANKIRNLEQEIRKKDQEVETLNRLIDQHTLDSNSEQNLDSVVSAKQVYTCNDRNLNCMLDY